MQNTPLKSVLFYVNKYFWTHSVWVIQPLKILIFLKLHFLTQWVDKLWFIIQIVYLDKNLTGLTCKCYHMIGFAFIVVVGSSTGI